MPDIAVKFTAVNHGNFHLTRDYITQTPFTLKPHTPAVATAGGFLERRLEAGDRGANAFLCTTDTYLSYERQQQQCDSQLS